MVNISASDNSFVGLVSKRLVRLLLGVSASWFLLPTGKALALNPYMFTLTKTLSITPKECQSGANKAANLIFTKVDYSKVETDYYQLIGRTSTASSTVYCTIGRSNTMLIVATSVNYSQYKQEALSINQKIADIIEGNI